MIARTFAAATLLILANVFPLTAAAVTLQTDDGCGTANSGTLTGTLSADASGNLTLRGFNNSKWLAGQGSCETALAAGSAPRCTLVASATNAQPNVPVTFHARWRTPAGVAVTSYTWIGPQGGPALPANAACSPPSSRGWLARPTFDLWDSVQLQNQERIRT
jgi:hypothetical protein